MSKVLIDRAVLEATLEHAEFVSGAACEADDAIRAVLAAPISTPELPIKAYYYEAPNGHGGLNKSVGLEQRKTFSDAPLVLESDALAQIACLEGEIAKRDETPTPIPDTYDDEAVERAAFEAWHKARYPAVKIRVQNLLGTYTDTQVERNFETWLACAESHSKLFGGALLDANARLYAAPVSGVKAHGVVMPADIKAPAGGEWGAGFKCGYESYKREFIHLNDAPAAPGAKP